MKLTLAEPTGFGSLVNVIVGLVVASPPSESADGEVSGFMAGMCSSVADSLKPWFKTRLGPSSDESAGAFSDDPS